MNWFVVILSVGLAVIAYRYRAQIRIFTKMYPLLFRAHRAQSLNYLMGLSLQEGRFSAAERYCRRLVKLQEKIQGEAAPELCPTLETFSRVLMKANKYDEAAKVLVRSGLIQIKYAERLHNKARELSSQGNYTEAEKCYTELKERAQNDLMPVDLAVSALKGYAILLNTMNRQGEITAVLELSREIQARAKNRTPSSE